MTEQIAPCPFCGSNAEINQIGNMATKMRGFEVRCSAWGCATKKRAMVIRHSLDEARVFAITAWNTRAAPALPVLEGWMTIDTAPRDGTDILVYFAPITGRLNGTWKVSWENLYGERTPTDGIWCVDDNKHGPYALRGYLVGDDTHWMPLPSPPDEGSSRSQPIVASNGQTETGGSGEADSLTIADYEAVITSHSRLVRELDVLLNGDGAAEQASLCDIISQLKGDA